MPFFSYKLDGLSREHQQIREFAGLQLKHFFLWHFDLCGSRQTLFALGKLTKIDASRRLAAVYPGSFMGCLTFIGLSQRPKWPASAVSEQIIGIGFADGLGFPTWLPAYCIPKRLLDPALGNKKG
jgi:hypothetical protein